MDFTTFLSNANVSERPVNELERHVSKKQIDKNDDLKILEGVPVKNNTKPINTGANASVYQHYKRGDFVKIVRYNNSIHNYYKGYIGEIKDYKPGTGTAVVFLYAINGMKCIDVPIEHFVKMTN